MSGRIAKGARVSLTYRLIDKRGRLLEERTPESPAIFVQGEQTILRALEDVLEGQGEGYQGVLRLTAADAFGEYDPALVAEIERSKFPPEAELAPGAKFSTIGPNGQPAVVRVLEADDEAVTVDGNHPLAGVDVIIEFTVLAVGVRGDGSGFGEGEGSEDKSGFGGAGPGGETIH